MNKKIELIINQLTSLAKAKLRNTPQPAWIEPMLATLTETYFSNKNYLYEHKWDGIRIIAYKHGDTVKLMTRNKNIATNNYPEIAKSLKKYNFDFIIDGEVIATQQNRSSFGLLQQRMHREDQHSTVAISYHVFDIMHIDNYNVTDLELLDRKFILQNAFNFKQPINLTEHILSSGLEYFKEACSKGWEGVIAKEIHARYEIGTRSRNWLKFKCVEEQELVIGGFTRPQGHRLDFGALLLGYYDNEKLLYAGKVGTGFSFDTLKTLGAKLEKLKTEKNPFESVDIPTHDVYWVKPKLVAEIRFTEWTSYNKLRHPRFLGLRDDKDAKEVTREKAIKII